MTLPNLTKHLAMVRFPARLTSPLRSRPVAESFRINCQVLRGHLINRSVHYHHSASVELHPACLFDRVFGAGRVVVGSTAVERIAEFARAALVVGAAVAAAAVEGLVVVVVLVDRTAALAVAPVDWPEVAVGAVE